MNLYGVDIIIPIFNAYEDLQACLKSVIKNTILEFNRLILVNDNSTDLRVTEYLQELEAIDNIIIINNSVNRGFSYNINLGIQQSAERDVILLNSDTIVTHRWLEKIVSCAYSDESVGTVTPVSNNASLCSVPAFCEENILPAGMQIEEAAAIVERCSMKKYPEITVANGFCMYIKREVINLIGYFDSATFGRGYGEENDFCNRAGQAGYIHVMCDDTYIYHNGTKSFISEEKEQLMRDHEAILFQRYPYQTRKNQVFCRDNPNGWVGDNISLYFDIYNNKKNIMYVLQSDFKSGSKDNIGGTQLHVKNLTNGLKNQYNIFVVARNGLYLDLTIYTSECNKYLQFYIGEESIYPLIKDRECDSIYKDIIVGFGIDLIHVHHSFSNSMGIYELSNELQIPLVCTLHDFYYVCPTIKLLDYECKTCYNREDADCKKCLKSNSYIADSFNYIEIWRNRCLGALEKSERIFTPSNSAKNIISLYYKDISDKITIIEHGYQVNTTFIKEDDIINSDNIRFYWDIVEEEDICIKADGWAFEEDGDCQVNQIYIEVIDKENIKRFIPTSVSYRLDVSKDKKKSKCGFLAYIPKKILSSGEISLSIIIRKENGECLRHNGESYKVQNNKMSNNNIFNVAFIGGINAAKGGKQIAKIVSSEIENINFFVFGEIGEKELLDLDRKNLVKTGNYKVEDLETLLKLHNIDVICILSMWPETFSYTLSEAITFNVPVITTDFGALGERVASLGCGWSFPGVNVENDVLNLLEELKYKGAEYYDVYHKVVKTKLKSLDEMMNDYSEIYNTIIEQTDYKKTFDYDSNRIYNAYAKQERVKTDNSYLFFTVENLEDELYDIKNSKAYKLVLKIRKFKKIILKILRKSSEV